MAPHFKISRKSSVHLKHKISEALSKEKAKSLQPRLTCRQIIDWISRSTKYRREEIIDGIIDLANSGLIKLGEARLDVKELQINLRTRAGQRIKDRTNFEKRTISLFFCEFQNTDLSTDSVMEY